MVLTDVGPVTTGAILATAVGVTVIDIVRIALASSPSDTCIPNESEPEKPAFGV